MSAIPTFPLDVAGRIPHAPPMLVIDQVLGSDDTGTRAGVRVPADAWYLKADGTWDELGGIELIAQTAAASHGLSAATGGSGSAAPAEPAAGFLVEVRRYTATGIVTAGDDLVVRIKTLSEFSGFAVMEGDIRRGDTVLASAELTFWKERTTHA